MEYNIKFQKLSITTGSEGPAHDPYAYTIYTLHNNLRKVELKLGLVSTLKVDDKLIPIFDEDDYYPLFQEITNLSIKQFRKAYERIHNPKQCPKCGSTKREWFSGYIGEQFMACKGCGEIIDYSFNIGAVI